MSHLRFTRLAQEDLTEIGDYISKDNPSAALNFINRIKERCTALTNCPGTGRKRDEIIQNLRSATEGDYVIFYHAITDGIEILRIIHSKRDINKISFPKLGW